MKRTIAFLFLVLCLIIPVTAEELPILTLEEALSSASDSSVELESARIMLNQAMRNQDAVMTTFMPSISLDAGMSTGVDFSGASGTVYGSGMVDETAFQGLSVSAGATAAFTFSGSMLTDKEKRSIAKETAVLDFQDTWDSLEDAVIEAYWNISASSLSIKEAEFSLQEAAAQYESVSAMYENGLSDELSLRQSELALKQAELQLKALEDNRDILLSSFRNLTGVEGNFQTEELPDPVFLDLPEPEELFALYGNETIAVQSAENNVRSAKNTVDTLKLGTYVPVLSASVGYSYSGSGYQKYKDTVSGYSTAANGLTGSITVSLPISSMIPGSAEDMAIKDAEDNVKISALSLADTKDKLLESIREAVTTIQQQQDSIERENAAIETAERMYELSQEAFASGLLSSDDFSSARLDLLNEKLNLLSMETEHLLSCYSLASILDTDLASIQKIYKGEQQ